MDFSSITRCSRTRKGCSTNVIICRFYNKRWNSYYSRKRILIDEITQITSENELVEIFGKFNSSNFEEFFTAANF